MEDIKAKEKELRESFNKEKEELKDTYNDVIRKLKSEGEKLQGEFQREVENARKYVKKHPETGVGVALAGGLLIGLAISKILNR